MTFNTTFASIRFDKSLKDSILKDAKILTIREGIRDYYNLGETSAKFNDDTELNIVIEKIEFKKYLWDDENITSEHLLKENVSDVTYDGFLRLFSGLKRFYPDFEIGDDVTLIYFKRIP